MKRTIIFLLAASIIAGYAFAEDVTYTPLAPKNAKAMGMGGVFTSIPTSEFSFFGNPAAFAAKKASYTIVSVDAWAYVKATSDNVETLTKIPTYINDEDYASIYGLIPTNGGLGAGLSTSLSAFAGKGLGLGVFVTTDQWLMGKSLPSVADTDTEVSAVIGLGVPITFGDRLRLSIGGDLRPFYRLRGENVDVGAVVKGLAEGSDPDLYAIKTLNAGFGLALDLGASLELGPFGLGLSIRDIAPKFPVFQGSLGELMDAFQNQGGLPKTGDSAAMFLPDLSLGASWKPRFIPGLIEPSLYLELQDFLSVTGDNWAGAGSLLNLLHAGGELKLLSLVYLRGGINRGWLSAGAGVKLFFVDVNASVFTEELGALAGDRPRSGLALQAAFRF